MKADDVYEAMMRRAACRRLKVLVEMEGLPSAEAVLRGWSRQAMVQFKNGSLANVRKSRVTLVAGEADKIEQAHNQTRRQT